MRGRRFDREAVIVWVSLFALYLALGYFLQARLNLFVGDALARSYSARSVLFGHEPKIANIGFIWAPLPTLLQIPLLLFPPFRYRALTAAVVTAGTSAGIAVLILLFLRRAPLPRPVRWLIVAAYALNPYVLLYSSNGMSEMTLIFFTMLALYYYWRWIEEGHWLFLSATGVAAGLAGLSRYDGLFAIATLGLAIAVETLAQQPDHPLYSESSLLVYGAPPVYGFSLWILANWIIEGDPLFFARSETSAAGRIGGTLLGREWVVPLKGNLLGTAQATLATSWELFPAFLVVTLALIVLVVIRRNWHWFGVLLTAWSQILFTAYNVYVGGSNYLLRYFMSAIPMAFIIAAGILYLLPRWRTAVALLLVGGFAASGFATAQAMARPDQFDGDYRFLTGLQTLKPYDTVQAEMDLADYIDTRTEGLLLIDPFLGHKIMIFSRNQARFVIPADSEFDSFIRNPYGRVNYVAIPFQESSGLIYVDEIARVYPTLYADGAPWVRLEFESGPWRLYRVIGSPTEALRQNPADQIQPPK